MKKIELIKEIAEKTSTEKELVGTILEAFMTSVEEHIANNDRIALSGFGSFRLKRRAAKMGRNISANTPIKVPAQYVPAFKPSEKFKEKARKISRDFSRDALG